MTIKPGILLITWVIIFLTACSKPEEKQAGKMGVQKDEAVIVRTAKVIKQTVMVPLRVYGQSEEFRRVDIFPKINGVVVEQKAELGDIVQKDEVLALIRQDIPGMDFSLSKIKATVSGLVTAENIEVGGTVNVQRTAFTISQCSPILVAVSVLDVYLRFIRPGQVASIEFDALPGKTFKGKIYEIAPRLDNVNHSLNVRIRLSNPDKKIKPGMFARVKFNLTSHQGFLIPVDAVIRTGAEKFVFLVQDGKAVKHQVTTGLMQGNFIEILSGVKKGDTVVTLGQNYLDEGTPVQEKHEG